MLFAQDILPAIVGLMIGFFSIIYKLGWLKWIKINDKYGIFIPCLVTLTLPFIFTYIFELIKDFDSSNNWIAILIDLAPLGTFFTITIGFLTFSSNQRIKRDEETTKQAVLALERAYEILTDNGKNIVPVLADRYNWLATARMLTRYEKLKKKLKTDLYKIICEEQEEYWSHRFYLLIKKHKLYPYSYFVDIQDIPIIKPDSAVIIFGFTILGFPGGKETNDDINKRLAGALLMHDGLNNYLKKYSDALEDNLFSRAFKAIFPLVLI